MLFKAQTINRHVVDKFVSWHVNPKLLLHSSDKELQLSENDFLASKYFNFEKDHFFIFKLNTLFNKLAPSYIS